MAIVRKQLFMLLTLLIASCSSVPMMTDIDLAQQEQNGNLEAFYQQLQAEKKLAKPDSEVADNRNMYIDIVGRKIAQQKEQAIFDELGRGFSQHSISTLYKALEKSTQISVYNEQVANDYRQQIDQAISLKRQQLEVKRAAYEVLDIYQSVKKMALLDEMIEIYGPSSDADKVQEEKKVYFTHLIIQAEQAFVAKDYALTAKIIKQAEKLNKDSEEVKVIQNKLTIARIEKKLWDALEEGNKDRAFFALQEMLGLKDYINHHPEILPVAEDLAIYFQAEGDASVKEKKYAIAYPAYARAHSIRVAFKQVEMHSKEQKILLKWLEQQFKKAYANKQSTVAYGLLLVISEFDSSSELLGLHEAALSDSVLDESRIKILSGELASHQVLPVLGADIMQGIGQLVQQSLVNVKWIDAELAKSEYEAKKIVNLPNSSSYFVLSAKVNELGISEDVKEKKNVEQVVTAYADVENPEWLAWSALDEDEQQKMTVPTQTIRKEIVDNVEFINQTYKKESSIHCEFLLSDAVSASAILSKPVIKKREYKALRSNRIEKGIYIKAAIEEPLPEDASIYKDVLDDLANEIVTELAVQAELIQKNYLLVANRSAVEENFVAATQYYAYAFALKRKQGIVDEDLLDKVRVYAIRVSSAQK